MSKHPDHPKHRATLHAAATTDVHQDPHETETHPEVLDLSADQKKLVSALHFLSDYEIVHTPKVSGDVAAAFDGGTLSTIEANAELGGAARAARVRDLQKQHEQLSAIAAIVAPVARLVGQNLMVVDAQLAKEAGEALKVAASLSRSRPAMREGLAALDRWSKSHHRGRAAAPAAAAATPAPAKS